MSADKSNLIPPLGEVRRGLDLELLSQYEVELASTLCTC